MQIHLLTIPRDKEVGAAMLVGHQWMPVSAEDKKIVNGIGASMVNEGTTTEVTPVLSIKMAIRLWSSVAIFRRNGVNMLLVVFVVVVVVVDYEQSLLFGELR